MKSIIIGDVHGCYYALNAMLKKLQPDPDLDRLIFLGDLFDRGPCSWEVFNLVRELAVSFRERFILLRGNHEDYLLDRSLTFSKRLIWSRVGRGTTVQSFKAHGEKMESAIPWLETHCVLYYKEKNFQCVHAGIRVDPLETNDLETMIHDHSVVMDNHFDVPLTITGHIALSVPTWFAGDGDTTMEMGYGTSYSLPASGVICIDTGCGKGGSLTAMTIENGRFILDTVNEKGEIA